MASLDTTFFLFLIAISIIIHNLWLSYFKLDSFDSLHPPSPTYHCTSKKNGATVEGACAQSNNSPATPGQNEK